MYILRLDSDSLTRRNEPTILSILVRVRNKTRPPMRATHSNNRRDFTSNGAIYHPFRSVARIADKGVLDQISRKEVAEVPLLAPFYTGNPK